MSFEPPAPGPTVGAAVVATEWRMRTQAEYTSAAIAHQVTLWLIQLGGPPDLIRDGLRIVDDELTHSELSAAVMAACGGVTAPPVIDGSSLTLAGAGAGGPDSRSALVSAVLRFFCVGETVAVPLFRMLRERCSEPVARHALDRVLRDEARHRQFGWDVLDWLLLVDAGAGHVVRQVQAELPSVLADVEIAYGDGSPSEGSGDADDVVLGAEVASWGLASRADYARTLSAALAHDVLPRLAARGVDLATSGYAT